MKKLLSTMLLLTLFSNVGQAFAEPLENIPEETPSIEASAKTLNTVQFTLTLTPEYYHSVNGQAILNLADGEKNYALTVDLTNTTPTQTVTFYVDPYTAGKAFYLSPISGIDKLDCNGVEYSFSAPIGFYPTGGVDFEAIYKPIDYKPVNIFIHGNLVGFNNPPRYVAGEVMVPMNEMSALLGLTYINYNGIHTTGHLLSTDAVITVDESMQAFIETKSTPKTPKSFAVQPQIISETLFVPLSLFTDAFNIQSSIEASGYTPNIYLAPGSLYTDPSKNTYVNSVGLKSDTDYLVWTSKSEYKTRVYLKNEGAWYLIKEFTCGIGAPGTPTCEGTYKYYQAHKMWDYGYYYVGPIMRFNGGYALHSTLLYKNGTPMDDRVGIKLSHGCIRLRANDINWMAAYVPLYTTIHITG